MPVPDQVRDGEPGIQNTLKSLDIVLCRKGVLEKLPTFYETTDTGCLISS